MVDLHRHSFSQLDEPRTRSRWGSLANERSIFELLGNENRLQPTPLTLAPVNANIYARRHSAHTCSMTEECPVPACTKPIPPAVPLRPPAVPKRTYVPPPTKEPPKKCNRVQPPPVPPATFKRALPPIPVDSKPRPPIRNVVPPAIADSTHHVTFKKSPDVNNKNASVLQSKHVPVASTFEYTPNNSQEQNRIPSAPHGPPPAAPKLCHKTSVSPAPKPTPNQQCTTAAAKVSMRQDSSVSSDSFSQTSSPSYTTKTMETPLLPRTPIKQNNCRGKPESTEDDNGNSTITKSASTPASLQTIVRFHNGSNMSLHHKIIRDIRRPSGHYVRRKGLRFRFAQIVLNAIALLAIGGGMAAYFKAFPSAVHVTNNTIINSTTTAIPLMEKAIVNPAPGICLPVIVSFCQQHKVPYNFTVFPNYMGHFGQRDAQQELEVYDAVVDVRCYELAALFLCSVFVPKCGPRGDVVRPCRSLCAETKRRCGFFLDVFGLALPDYLECNLFPESADPDVCVGHHEVKEAKIRSQKPVCPTGFQCDLKRCIPSDWKCDGHVDCKDQTDELNCDMCGPDMIHCGADKCMIQEHMCDGKVDCPWAQDERNCLRLSERNGDEGRGRLEVYHPGQQKWVPACIDDWDSTSPGAVCSLLGYSNSTGSQILKASDLKLGEAMQETTAVWRMYQNNRPKNILKEFGSCKGKSYRTVDITCTNYMCGKARKTYAETSAKRIVGGVRSKPGDWPFLAALLGGPEEIFYCAGVLIADEWVLTASHCVGNHSDVSGWTIQLGITRRHAHSYYGQKVKVRRVVPHPMYNLGIAHDNDVALFQLSSRVTFHEHLLPVCLPSADKVLHPGTMCTVIGWGKKEDTGMSEYEPEVNEVQVPVLNRDLCNSWLENRELNVTDGMICAGYKEGGKDACQGDSGGPLLCRDDEEPWFVGGIVSWGIKCAHPHLPGVYAYVPKYIPWILQQMKHYSD